MARLFPRYPLRNYKQDDCVYRNYLQIKCSQVHKSVPSVQSIVIFVRRRCPVGTRDIGKLAIEYSIIDSS